MVNALLGLVSGVTVNYISDELIQRLGAYTDKKTIREFLEALNSWALDFETGRDGTIAASGAFHSYLKHYHIVEQAVSYVLVPDTIGLSEQLFLEQLEQTMSRELEQQLGRKLSPEDSQVIRVFLGSLLRQTKSFTLRQTALEDKALLYYLCQNNAEISQIKQTMEEQFQCTKEMIQKILCHLESPPQVEMVSAPTEDETQLPKEFNMLIQKCNDALRESQRTVKVYFWDDLDFKSVYILPTLELSIESNITSYYDASYLTSKDISAELSSRWNSIWDNKRPSTAKTNSPKKRRRIINKIFQNTDIVYVIGGAGYGKSLFLKNLCVYPPQCMQSDGNHMLIIRGDLKRIIRPDGSFKPMLEYLSECLTNGSLQSPGELPPDFLQRCLRAGRCLILLDALDEVGNDQRNELHRLVISYFRDSGINNKVCITSRDRGFIPEKKIFCLSIQPITEKDVREYVDRFIALDKFPKEEKDRFVEQASNLVNKGFVKGFLTLSLLLAIYKNQQNLPANKVALYQKCFEYIANTREKNKNLLCNSSTGRVYNWDMLDKLMEDATFMELAQLGTPNNRDIPRDAIDELMIGLYVQRFYGETECRTAIDVFLQFCADRTEVFVPSPNSNTEYRFFHRSFYEFFYANYIVTRTRCVEDTYRKLNGFGVDSELFELLVQLYNKNNPSYLRELIQYAFKKAEARFQNPTGGVAKAFDILIMLMQTVDENDLLERFIRLFLDRGNRISDFSLCVDFNMISAVFEKKQVFFIRYFEENWDNLLDQIAIELSKLPIWNQDDCIEILRNTHPHRFFWNLESLSHFQYRWLLWLLPNRLMLIDQIFKKMETPQYMYCTLKVKESHSSNLASFVKKVRKSPVEERERIYTALIKKL